METAVDPTPFEVSFGSKILRGDEFGSSSHAILLHGAGNSSRSGFTRLRHAMHNYGISSVSFDFIGHGETGGELLGSSLRERTAQAAAVIRKHCTLNPCTVIAASMGAHIAIKLTELFPIDNLVLLVPAVYSQHAYNIPFGPRFTKAIRTPHSWHNSDAFDILRSFCGSLIIIAAESDNVIPAELVNRLHGCAKNARCTYYHIVPGSSHLSLFPTLKTFQWAAKTIAESCKQVEGHS